MSEFRIDQITNQSGSRGPDIAGITTFSATSGMLMPSGTTEYRGGRGRGLFAGGYAPGAVNTIDYITIETLSNATDFGDLSGTSYDFSGGCSSSTRALFAGGYRVSYSNIIDYVTMASLGDAIDFGDLTQSVGETKGCSNGHGGL